MHQGECHRQSTLVSETASLPSCLAGASASGMLWTTTDTQCEHPRTSSSWNMSSSRSSEVRGPDPAAATGATADPAAALAVAASGAGAGASPGLAIADPLSVVASPALPADWPAGRAACGSSAGAEAGSPDAADTGAACSFAVLSSPEAQWLLTELATTFGSAASTALTSTSGAADPGTASSAGSVLVPVTSADCTAAAEVAEGCRSA